MNVSDHFFNVCPCPTPSISCILYCLN